MATGVTATRTEIAFGRPAGRWVLAATVLGSSMAFIDATVVNIALPAIGHDLGAGLAGQTWTVNAYTLTLASFILLGGSLGDRVGRRRMFVVGVAWFAAASLLCGAAPNIETLVAARALQGIGGALLTPGSRAILQASFRADARSRAIGAWSGLGGIAAAVGPFLGGWLVQAASWRWVFLINLPVAAVVLLIAQRRVPESLDPQAAPRTDAPGAVLVVVSLGALTYGLVSWPAEGPGAPQVVAGLAVGLAALVAFLVRERSAAYPMLPLSLFGSHLFSAVNLVTFTVYAALGGVFLWLVVTLQVVAGFGPTAAGVSLLPVTVIMLALSARAGALAQRIGPRLPMTAGPLVSAVGVLGLLRVGPDASYLADVLGPVVVFGLGLSLTVAPLTASVLSAVPETRTGLASGVNNAVARTAGLVAVAILPVVTGLGVDGFNDPTALAPAFRTAMLVCAALLALGGVLSFVFVRVPPALTREPAARRHCAVGAPPICDACRDRPGAEGSPARPLQGH
jgi:EmrB/QacA subfamily drug resistance transporter